MKYYLNILFFIVVFLVNSITLRAQQLYDWSWPLGGFNQTILQFSENGLRIQPTENNANMLLRKTSSAISDSSGALIMYTNGFIIADGKGRRIINGDTLTTGKLYMSQSTSGIGGLVGNIYPNGAIFLPYPRDPKKYILVYNDSDFWDSDDILFTISPKSYYAIIENTSEGLKVADKYILLEDEVLDGFVYGIPHLNGEDYWIVTCKFNSNEYLFYLLTENGIKHTHRDTIGIVNKGSTYFSGIKLSPDGNTLGKFRPIDGLELFDIDRSTGRLSNYRQLDIPTFIYPQQGSLDFSPSGRFIYFNDATQVYQVDLHAEDWKSSVILIDTFDNYRTPIGFFTAFREMKRTPDCRIFVTAGGSTPYIHVIHEPDKPGKACRFEQRSIDLGDHQFSPIPNMPEYNVGFDWESYCDLLSSTKITSQESKIDISIWPNPCTSVVSFQWDEQITFKEVLLFNMSGNLLHSKRLDGTSQSSIWMYEYPAGVYLLVFTDAVGNTYHRRVLKR